MRGGRSRGHGRDGNRAGGIDSSIIHRNHWHREIRKVPVRPLDDVVTELKLPKVSFVKLDVEGYEENVINGSRKLIERDRPAWSISSYHRDASTEPQYPKLLELLRSLGYQLSAVPFFHICAW